MFMFQQTCCFSVSANLIKYSEDALLNSKFSYTIYFPRIRHCKMGGQSSINFYTIVCVSDYLKTENKYRMAQQSLFTHFSEMPHLLYTPNHISFSVLPLLKFGLVDLFS